MELFAVNRYVEEDDDEVVNQDSAKALKRLRKEAKRRRKALEAEAEAKTSVETVATEEQITEETEIKSVKKKKKKKKRKHETENGVLKDENDINEDEIISKKKIKKEKNETEQSVEVKVSKTIKKRLKSKAKKLKNKNKDRDFMVIGEPVNYETKAVKRVLPDWLAKPTVFSMDLRDNLTKVKNIPGLCPSIVAQLRANGIKHFFPVQSCVISCLLDSFTRNWIRQPDLCVSSPTGSGKTLAFALPIIHALSQRFVCSVKALIVLPVGDLATQVFEVFKTYTQGTFLNVGLAIGKHSLSKEQRMLVSKGKRGYNSKIDILVCTPGKLVEHLTNTPGFTLIDLRFLVIDEADRMMQEVKQDWLSVVETNILKNLNDSDGNIVTVKRMTELRNMPQKLLFSATLSQNPVKLQQMRLFHPKLFSAVNEVSSINGFKNDEFVTEFAGRYTTPKELKELYVVCDLFVKPLIILHLLNDLGYRHMLCFTNSVQNSHRLCLLLSAYGGISVLEFTSALTENQRKGALKKFTEGSIDVIVCSDSLARGMDVENVDYVVSYDFPHYLKSYVHRVGRTARAGRSGTAISLVEKGEVVEFKKMMETRHQIIEKLSVGMEQLEPMEERYRQALEYVKMKINKERTNKFEGNENRRKLTKRKNTFNKRKN